jgi:hypothetical protein
MRKAVGRRRKAEGGRLETGDWRLEVGMQKLPLNGKMPSFLLQEKAQTIGLALPCP